jgi:hypothetical protein
MSLGVVPGGSAEPGLTLRGVTGLPRLAGWLLVDARAGGYALVLALIAAKAVKDRLGSKLGFYFAIVPAEWVLQVVVLLLVLASQRGVRLGRGTLPAVTGLGAVTAGVAWALNPFGVPGSDSSAPGNWWWLTALLPLATGTWRYGGPPAIPVRRP